ncbi:MAG: integrase arm-type DNA-binding domain-containing protein [Proteobacteria bacterium]|nr:integrase arm-type DNA-binding domain-containing protein [Pseudomonadota bacterium]
MLTNTEVAQAKKSAKAYKLTDGAGLYLEVTPSGGKHWRYRFRLHGKESTFSLGEYPSVTLSAARKQREEARELVKAGINPAQNRKIVLLQRKHEAATTFEAVAAEWYAAKSGNWSTGYAHHVKTVIDEDINKFIGALPIKDIKTPAVYEVVRRVEKRQAPTRAILARQIIGAVFKLAILTHRAEFDVAAPIKGEIARRVVEHHKHLRQDDIPDFLRKLEDYTGHVTTKIALKLLMLTAVRPGELCGAAWGEFDLDRAEWRIPAARMKMKTAHFVPLPLQAITLLQELKELTGHETHLFPSQGTKSPAIPTATLRNAVMKMGYGEKFSPHGARGTFSTMCNELGFRPDVIERQLAHSERNKIRASYNQAEYLTERRAMMQQYADMLDALKAGAQIIPFGKAA